MDNYTPISLLMTCSKILERVMLNRLVQYFEVNKILSAAQFGYQKNSHIDHAVYFLLNNIVTQLDQQKQVGGIFCDLTKAFDCVNHSILLNKPHYYGISGACYSWLESYLVNRKQKIWLPSNSYSHGISSDRETVVSGIHRAQFWDLCFLYYM